MVTEANYSEVKSYMNSILVPQVLDPKFDTYQIIITFTGMECSNNDISAIHMCQHTTCLPLLTMIWKIKCDGLRGKAKSAG